jgi:hypothetical protein
MLWAARHFRTRLERLAHELAALHNKSLGEVRDARVADPFDPPSIAELEALKTTALHLAAHKIYALDRGLRLIATDGARLERQVITILRQTVFSEFWNLVLLRDNPAAHAEPFPDDIVVPTEFMLPQRPRNWIRDACTRREAVDDKRVTSWSDVIDDALDLFVVAIEALVALEGVCAVLDEQVAEACWRAVSAPAKRARVFEVGV